jgi:hypothetical protein
MLACSGVALGQVAEQTDATQTALSQWGKNVLVTSVLTRGQSLETLFSNNLLVSDMVAQWRANFQTTPPAVAEAQEIKAALDVLVRAFTSDRRLNWTAQDVLVGEWEELPGGQIVKRKIRAAFEILKADGVMCLSFLNRAENEEAPQELVTAMFSVLDNPALSILTHLDLYTTGATVEQYSDADMDLLAFAMDEVRLIRTEQPDRRSDASAFNASATDASGISTMGMSAAASIGSCCSRTTRKCVEGGTAIRCSVCGVTCCLGSAWCV